MTNTIKKISNTSKKALFVLHEGIGSTIFNSQVLEHVKGMRELGIEFDILAYDTLKKTWQLSNNNLKKIKKNNPNVSIILKKGKNIYYPFSLIYNFLILLIFLINNKNKYSFIHARADYTTFLCIISKPFHQLPVFWDCRGDSVSELRDSLSRKNSLVKILGVIFLVSFDRFANFVNCKLCNGAIFVSQALFNLFKSKLITKNYQIIPCPVSEKLFYFDLDLRTKMRNQLNIQENNVVYLYSGSMVAYQSLSEQYKLYNLLLKKCNNIIIVATSEPQIARDFFKDLSSERLIITSLGFNEMNSYYNLADFAFLIRDEKQLNFVASPTKFGEYCLTGLPVIMNDTVNQAVIFAKNLGNYVSSSCIIDICFSNNLRYEISSLSKDIYSREVLNSKYIFLYTSFLHNNYSK